MKAIKKIVRKFAVIVSAIMVTGSVGFTGYKTYEWTAVPKTVFADREVVVEVQKRAEVMDRIAKCEGKTQFKKNGDVVMNLNKNNSWDVGKYQINEATWGPTAAKMGVNIFTEEGNEKFAYWLYQTRGTEPWIYSKSCWSK